MISARSLRRFTLLLLFSPLLVSCLTTETEVTLRRDGSGRIDLSYEIDRGAWETGVFDDSDVARPIPVTRYEFEEAAIQIDGLELRSHRVSGSDETVTVNATVAFDSIEALRRFLGPGSLEVELSDDGGVWRQVVAEGRGAQEGGAAALAESLEEYSMSFRIDPPGQITATNGVLVGDGDAATFSVPLSDVVRATSEIVWEARW